MSAVTFAIPNNLWLTSNRHIVNRGHKASIVSRLHQLAVDSAKDQGLEPVAGQVYAHWDVRYPKGVRTDKGEASNAQPTTKALLDGLVPTWLEDDGPKYVIAETFRRGPNLAVQKLHEIRLTLTSQEVPW